MAAVPEARKPPVSPTTAEFGRRVRARRTEMGLSQEALAADADIHWSYLGQIERGHVNLTLHSIVRLAATLKVDAGTLVSSLPVPPESRM